MMMMMIMIKVFSISMDLDCYSVHYYYYSASSRALLDLIFLIRRGLTESTEVHVSTLTVFVV